MLDQGGTTTWDLDITHHWLRGRLGLEGCYLLYRGRRDAVEMSNIEREQGQRSRLQLPAIGVIHKLIVFIDHAFETRNLDDCGGDHLIKISSRHVKPFVRLFVARRGRDATLLIRLKFPYLF